MIQEESTEVYLDTIHTQDAKSWTSVVRVNGNNVPFKLDTGAEVTAISEDVYTNPSIASSSASRTNSFVARIILDWMF